MEYVLAGLVVVLVVGIGITVFTLSARRHARREQRTSSDRAYGAGLPGTDTAIFAPDRESPLGDTPEHAGEQREGETVAGQDAEGSGGSGRARASGYAGTRGIGDRGEGSEDEGGDTGRPVVGGEGEGTRRIPRER